MRSDRQAADRARDARPPRRLGAAGGRRARRAADAGRRRARPPLRLTARGRRLARARWGSRRPASVPRRWWARPGPGRRSGERAAPRGPEQCRGALGGHAVVDRLLRGRRRATCAPSSTGSGRSTGCAAATSCPDRCSGCRERRCGACVRHRSVRTTPTTSGSRLRQPSVRACSRQCASASPYGRRVSGAMENRAAVFTSSTAGRRGLPGRRRGGPARSWVGGTTPTAAARCGCGSSVRGAEQTAWTAARAARACPRPAIAGAAPRRGGRRGPGRRRPRLPADPALTGTMAAIRAGLRPPRRAARSARPALRAHRHDESRSRCGDVTDGRAPRRAPRRPGRRAARPSPRPSGRRRWLRVSGRSSRRHRAPAPVAPPSGRPPRRGHRRAGPAVRDEVAVDGRRAPRRRLVPPSAPRRAGRAPAHPADAARRPGRSARSPAAPRPWDGRAQRRLTAPDRVRPPVPQPGRRCRRAVRRRARLAALARPACRSTRSRGAGGSRRASARRPGVSCDCCGAVSWLVTAGRDGTRPARRCLHI